METNARGGAAYLDGSSIEYTSLEPLIGTDDYHKSPLIIESGPGPWIFIIATQMGALEPIGIAVQKKDLRVHLAMDADKLEDIREAVILFEKKMYEEGADGHTIPDALAELKRVVGMEGDVAS